jgi:hypothetical protein
MGLPLNNGFDGYHPYTFYQGVLASELVCTFSVFLIIQTIHYCIWGHDQEIYEFKKNEEGDAAVEPLPESDWVLFLRPRDGTRRVSTFTSL